MWALLLNKYVLGAALGAALLAGAYFKGHMDAAADCHDAALRAQIATLNADIENAKSAASDAAARTITLETARQSDAQKVLDYEQALEHAGDSCGLSDSDLKRLRDIGPSERPRTPRQP